MESVADEAGWAHLGGVGSKIANQAPDFDPRNYGYKRLGELVAATQLFDIEERLIGDGPSRDILIRDKKRKATESTSG
ncbi:MAG TPA: OST-HTH/LOTUS domain-containing protein [Candidatus Eisenbacteria bacterium]|nr:OST-HTH/LOTUS domain-containing protein [Candidatus Eisenbacteria bacterium]